jgi:predicted nucleic acid-binding protein
MTFSSCLINHDGVIVLDASVIINLLATGHASEILQALKVPLVVTGNVVREIEQGLANGRPESALLAGLITSNCLQLQELSGLSLEHFFSMVSGNTSDSLGDGEAATLALAHCSGCSAAIDEKKATRIACERYVALELVTTVDILAHEPIRALLGHATLVQAVVQALQVARMQVRPHQLNWVAQLIGEDNLARCASLKIYARRKMDHRSQ